jgi:hypothetical protein
MVLSKLLQKTAELFMCQIMMWADGIMMSPLAFSQRNEVDDSLEDPLFSLENIRWKI